MDLHFIKSQSHVPCNSLSLSLTSSRSPKVASHPPAWTWTGTLTKQPDQLYRHVPSPASHQHRHTCVVWRHLCWEMNLDLWDPGQMFLLSPQWSSSWKSDQVFTAVGERVIWGLVWHSCVFSVAVTRLQQTFPVVHHCTGDLCIPQRLHVEMER